MVLISFFLVVCIIYYFFDPSKYNFFLKCPLKSLTGYDCAGCGVQRALHSLLHFRIKEAFLYHPLFVIAVPILLVWQFLKFFLKNYEKCIFPVFSFGNSFFIVFVLIILLFSLIRNTDVYHHFLENF